MVMTQCQAAILFWDSGPEHELGIRGERTKCSINSSNTNHLFDVLAFVSKQAELASHL